VFAQNIGKTEPIKERDGLLFSIEHDVAFVISVKAKFGEKEKNELLEDVEEGKFDLDKWLFKTKTGTMQKLPEIKYYEDLLQGKKIFNKLIGVAISPLFSPHLSLLTNYSNLIALERKIPHSFATTPSSQSKQLTFFIIIFIYYYVYSI
jgi:hypothetical protein